ncbi:MAG: AAA family ATPase [Acidobacteriota bacterium]
MAQLGIRLDPARTGRAAESLLDGLRHWIVGQDAAIAEIVNIFQMHITGMSPLGRPIGSFLFLGPTGSGKTRIVEATAKCLVGSPSAAIKIDCGEFQHSHEIAKLIGSPPGYLGHRETSPLLCQETLDRYHTERVKISFVLFDEIEKASDALWNLLLGILDKGTLTLGDNRRVDFSRAMIFMTGNLGAARMSAIMAPRLGFNIAAPAPGAELAGTLSQAAIEAARRRFTPEFINRLDKIVVFKPLGEAELRKILDIELRLVQQRIFRFAPHAFVFSVTEPAKDHLLAQGTDLKYGARHLKRAIERLLVQPISNLIVTEQVRTGDWIQVDFDPRENRMSFMKVAQGTPAYAMAQALENPLPLPAAELTDRSLQSRLGRNQPHTEPRPKGAVRPALI